MSKQTLTLNNTNIEKLAQAEAGKRYMVYDTKCPYLAVRVTDKGAKSFVIQMRHKGVVVKVTLGQFPKIKIDKAREEYIKNLNDLSDGKNPNEEKKKIRQEMTLKELFEMYMERYSKVHKKSWIYDEREIPKFLSQWFSRKISDVTKQQIQKLHETITRENGAYQANRMLERIKSMYNRAIEWGWDGKNPAVGIRKNKEIKRDRFLKPAEFPAFFQSLEQETNIEAKNYIWLSLLTGARKSNVLAMRWDEIDFERKVWHIPETKNGDPLDVPLVDHAIQLLKGIDQSSEWVFPSPTSKSGYLQDPKRPWQRILERAGLSNLRIHDIRRTLASYQAITGTPLNIIGKTLGQKSVEATQIYARLHNDPVRDSMNKAVEKMLEYKKD